MKLANLDGRATVVTDGGGIDVAKASDGEFGPDVQSLFGVWGDFVSFAVRSRHRLGHRDRRVPARPAGATTPPGLRDRAQLPRPRRGVRRGGPLGAGDLHQVPGVDHGTFRRGRDPDADDGLGGGARRRHRSVEADRVSEADAWSHVAGLTVGQDISERTLQFAAAGQFCLGKSYRGLLRRSGRGSSRPTSWPTRTISGSGVRGRTARRCSPRARAT